MTTLGATPSTTTFPATAADVGAQVADADIPTVSASQVEMEAGTEAALRSMSPLRIKQAIDEHAGAGTDDQTAAEVPFTPVGTIAATDTQAAVAEVATDAASALTTHAGAADPHTGYQLESGLAAAITATKLDDLATPDDNTDLNATTGVHGLLPKLGGGSTNFLRADGTWNAPPGGGGAPTDAQYLVGAAHGDLSAEIVVTASGLALLDDASAAAQRVTLGLGAAALIPVPYLPYRTGGTFYYGWWTGAVSNLVLVQNTMYCAPFFVPVATTFTKIGVVSGAIASSAARLGIYSDTAGVPDALVLDAGSIATTTAAFQVITISQALAAGWYWLACAVQGAAGQLYCNNSGFFANAAVPVGTPGSSFIAGGYSTTGITGALPSPWGATKTETGRVPNMWLAPA